MEVVVSQAFTHFLLATPREAGARFINLDVSTLTDKWYGESQKLAGAVFTLAVKIQPTIIFIDEIDSLLRVRNQHDHEATAMIKAQFMQLWDGLSTVSHDQIVRRGFFGMKLFFLHKFHNEQEAENCFLNRTTTTL